MNRGTELLILVFLLVAPTCVHDIFTAGSNFGNSDTEMPHACAPAVASNALTLANDSTETMGRRISRPKQIPGKANARRSLLIGNEMYELGTTMPLRRRPLPAALYN